MEEANGPTMCLVVAVGFKEMGDGSGISLGDGQMEAPGVPAESEGTDALFQCMLSHLIRPVVKMKLLSILLTNID